MKFTFSGHESFPCKSAWLKKGYDFVLARNSFTDDDSVVKLGVGKNMVASINYWLKSFGLTENNEPTPIAKILFDDNTGYDPYLEDINTLWLLHYLLVSNRYASIYWLFFMDFQRERRTFDKTQFLLFINRKIATSDNKSPISENSIKTDINVLIKNYLLPSDTKSVEDFSSLLIWLNLIRLSDKNAYDFVEKSSGDIDASIILYALLDMKGEDNTVSMDTLNNISLLFCLPMPVLNEQINELVKAYSQQITYSNNSGIRNVQFLAEMDKYAVLNRYYKAK